MIDHRQLAASKPLLLSKTEGFRSSAYSIKSTLTCFKICIVQSLSISSGLEIDVKFLLSWVAIGRHIEVSWIANRPFRSWSAKPVGGSRPRNEFTKERGERCLIFFFPYSILFSCDPLGIHLWLGRDRPIDSHPTLGSHIPKIVGNDAHLYKCYPSLYFSQLIMVIVIKFCIIFCSKRTK